MSKYEARPNADKRHSVYSKEKRNYDTFSRGLVCSCGKPRSNHSARLCRECLTAARRAAGTNPMRAGVFARTTEWFDEFVADSRGRLIVCRTRLHGDLKSHITGEAS